MADNRYNKLARILVNYSNEVKKGDLAIIVGYGMSLTPITIPLVREIFLEVLKAGGHPYIAMNIPEQDYLFYSVAQDFQLEKVSPLDDLIVRTFDVEFRIMGSTNTRSLESIDPKKIQIVSNAYEELGHLFMERQSDDSFRWVLTAYPTAAYAQDAGMSITEFTDFIFSTTHADEDDPVKYWTGVEKNQQKIIDWMERKESVHILGDGIDLVMSIKDRKFINGDGKKNMPCGEIFTGPVENSINGNVRFSYPCIFMGNEVNGVELNFANGKVINASADKGEDFLIETLKTDEGASYLGEFGIGTNYGVTRFTKNMLFDEKTGGTIHLALGAGYPQSGSKNQSAIHWDLLTDMRDGGQIYIDDELIYESGHFKIE
jgi:aminopeptidase